MILVRPPSEGACGSMYTSRGVQAGGRRLRSAGSGPGLSGVGVRAGLVAGRAGAGAASGAGAGGCGRRGHPSHRAMVVVLAPPGAALLELQSN